MQDSESPEMNERPAKRIETQKIYIKDISYEAPGTPQIFTEKWEPQVSQDMRNSHNQLSDVVYEASLIVTITVKIGDKVAYLIEVNQAGIFNLIGYNEEEIEGILAIFCPTTLFPYVREAITDLSSRGGFPALVLQHVSFADMYHEYVRSKKEAQGEGDDEGGSVTH